MFISGSVSFVSGLRAQGFDLSRAHVVNEGPSARDPRAKELRRKLVRDSTHLQKLDFTTLCISHKKLGGVTAGKFMCAFGSGFTPPPVSVLYDLGQQRGIHHIFNPATKSKSSTVPVMHQSVDHRSYDRHRTRFRFGCWIKYMMNTPLLA